MLKKYPYIHQRDETDCGVTCLAMLAKYYGKNISISQLREEAGTDKIGTNILGLITASRLHGLNSTALKSNNNILTTAIQTPCIAHIKKENSNQILLHFVLIYQITESEVIYADPSKGLIKCRLEDFNKIWTGNLILCEPNSSFNDRQEYIPISRRLVDIVTGQKKIIVILFILSIIYTILGLLSSSYYRLIIDSIIPKNEMELLIKISLVFVGITIIQNILGYFRTETLLHLSKRFDTEILMGYYKHVIKLPLTFFTSRKTGEIVSRFTDASKVREAISSTIIALMLDTVLACGAGFMLYDKNKSLFVICVIICLIYGIIICFFNSKLREINEKQMSTSADLSSYMVESLEGIETIKSLNVEDKFIVTSYKKFSELMKTVLKNGKIINIQNCLSNNIASLGKIIILGCGSHYVMLGDLSIGSLMMFYMLMDYFINPIKTLLNLQPTIQTGKVAAERVYDIMDISQEDKDKIQNQTLIDLEGNIEIKNLNFRYASRKKILNNVNISLVRGEKTAIIGESGSGKSTLAKLLLGLYNIDRNQIFINGIDICDIPKNILRNKIAYVPQNIHLFSGTLLENIILGEENVDYTQVLEICRILKIDEFVSNLPLGYETQIEEGGANLSGGQKQRLAIARALIKKPNIIILDEATSNLDAITEKAFSEAINIYGNNITVLIIAHRLSTIINCNKIYVMKQGNVLEYGTHETLVRNGGYYYNFWKCQTSKNESSA